MVYGVPYQGSKNKIAEKIVRLLPKRKHLIDLFCGGCAVSHAAMALGKYNHVHMNDIFPMAQTLFVGALDGKYDNEKRWISHEDFFDLREEDPYVAIVYSFSNDMRSYLYSRQIEPYKKAAHYAIMFGEYDLALELGLDISFLEQYHTTSSKMQALSSFVKTNQIDGIAEADRLRLTHMEHLSRTLRLRAIKYTRHCSYTTSSLDYASVEIPTDSVIYCDIPYYNTKGYLGDSNFDHERFYEWCEKQTEPVFISSYEMPEDRFVCVKEIDHVVLCAKTTNTRTIERVFVPKHQANEFLNNNTLTNLFSFIYEE